METAAENEVLLDAELLARHRRGDPAAFDALVLRHRLAVYRVARRLVGNHEDADEAAQLTFVRAWRGLESFRGDAALRTWLVRIVINVVRSMRIGGRASAAVETHEEPEQIPDARVGSEEQLSRRQLGVRVRKAVADLPRRQREVVTLKVFSEMTHREVADVLGLTEGAVKAHLHQAVANLRRRMTVRGASHG